MSSCAEFVRIAAGARALGAVSKFATGKVTVWEFVTGGREDFMLNGWYPDTVRRAVREGRDARGKFIQSDVSPPDARRRQTFMSSVRGGRGRPTGARPLGSS